MSSESKLSLSDSEDDQHESSSSSSSEDEDARQWTSGMEKNFLAALSSLKCKDPKIYDETTRFFNETNQPQSENPSVSHASTAPAPAPLYLRDYERHIIIDKKGILEDESDNDDCSKDMLRHRPSDSHVEEEKRLRENLKSLLHSDDKDDDEDMQETCNAGFLKLKNKTHDEKLKEEEDYVQWLKGAKLQLNDREMEHQLKYLRDFWNDPTLNDDEKFLRDYVLNKKYATENQLLDQQERSPSPVQFELPFVEEEENLRECDEYEEKYNFRFEEPDQNFVKTYPRVIETSLRRKDETRKLKREERKLKKERKLELKRLEVKRAKKEKKRELMDRIEELKHISGNAQLGFDFDYLNDDFDADEYDKKMRQLFDEEFYNRDDDDMKPQFSSSDVDDEDDEPVEENIDNDMPTVVDAPSQGTRAGVEPSQDEGPTRRETRSSRRKGHKKSKFAQLTSDSRIPLFDPSEKTYQQYLDEYYNLDFEDVVGDTTCRFKYRKVTPNSFGLSIEEILAADDAELNKWCSLRKIDTIRPEQSEKFDLKAYSKRGADRNLKRKYFPSLFKEENQDKNETESESQRQHNRQTDNGVVNTRVSKRQRKRKKNMRASMNPANTSGRVEADTRDKSSVGVCKKRNAKEQVDSESNNVSKRRKLNLEEKRNNANEPTGSLSDDRLKAYGLNPKKFKNKMKYGCANDKNGMRRKHGGASVQQKR